MSKTIIQYTFYEGKLKDTDPNKEFSKLEEVCKKHNLIPSERKTKVSRDVIRESGHSMLTEYKKIKRDYAGNEILIKNQASKKFLETDKKTTIYFPEDKINEELIKDFRLLYKENPIIKEKGLKEMYKVRPFSDLKVE
jgi:hypothetical protein